MSTHTSAVGLGVETSYSAGEGSATLREGAILIALFEDTLSSACFPILCLAFVGEPSPLGCSTHQHREECMALPTAGWEKLGPMLNGGE